MREIFIKYNPYKLETEVTIDGEPVKANSALNVGERRLQEWIEELPKYLVEECNTQNFKITFQGTTLDYEDLLSSMEAAKAQGVECICEHIPAKEVKDKEQAIGEIFQEIQNGPFKELKDPDIVKSFEIAQSTTFPVNVVATMSAGKSTLINALLSQKLMPAKQEACTATITEITDNDNDKFIARVYDKNGELLEQHNNLTLDVMNKLNANPNVSKICAEGNIPFVDSDEVSLVLVDTPGPNNSRDPEHKAATYRMLDESSKTLVLYILNATQLAVNDDNTLLNHVAESMKSGGKQSRDRFIFVVNKLDEFKKNEDNVASALDKVRHYLEDKGIHNPNIFPASALTALNVRTILNNVRVVGYTEDELEELDSSIDEVIATVKKINKNPELFLEKYSPLTPSVRGKITELTIHAEELASKNNTDTVSRSDGMKQLALIHSGIVPIEEAIKMYVLKYAKTAKIKNIVDVFLGKLESQGSFEKAKQDIMAHKEENAQLGKQIDLIKSKIENGKEAKKFKDAIDAISLGDEIDDIVKGILGDAQTKIENTISVNDRTMSKREADSICETFTAFAQDLQASIQVKMENSINDNINSVAKDLLEQYKKRLANLASDVKIEGVGLAAFKMLQEDISAPDMNSMIAAATKTERVKVGEKWVENTDKHWYKPWTWFDEDGHYKDVYENQERVEGRILATGFFAPFEEQIRNYGDSAIIHSKKQTENIKKAFKVKFDELDRILNEKLNELKQCAEEQKDAEKRIAESEERLNWLKNIETKIEAILDI